ncbi:hypothetical protein DC366_05545 [Pelagivirga sediminicola]|uniref:Uncharacterized protein n=1 Tax=Pelagivirga sediminicola TaxID=2170575 RepID=A0A2T7G9Y6_9RHOB|nr:DUF6522 family protein [Pelagivirga sediminicola]PVA11219.1 hypothetical protein DC366_05545 [Pelagivirga sediminicola]
MKVMRDGDGATIDAADLGSLLDMPAADVAAAMRAGDITSQFETGTDEDAGTFRLTFWHRAPGGARRVRLTCADDGTVLKTSRTAAAPRKPEE